jgi:gliding motility-associated-like protein
MDDFEKIIKEKLNDYEMSYNKDSWNKLEKKLKKKNMIFERFLITTVSIIMFSFFVYNNMTINHGKHENNITKTEINKIDNKTNIVETEKRDTITKRIVERDKIVKRIVERDLIKIKSRPCEKIETKTPEISLIKISPQPIVIDTDTIKRDTTKQQYNLPPKLFFANAFSPNNDGMNDEFFPVGEIDLYPFHFYIYDRWGQLIFETMNINVKWKGDNCGQGLYVYVYKYQMGNNKWETISGKIQLIK